MPRYVMTIDATRCMNCKACVVSCQQRHGLPYDAPRNWVREHADPTAPSGLVLQPGACMHCDAPPCVDACPTGATYKASDGVVMQDTSRCIGCGACVESCPYGARTKIRTGVVDKCDTCVASRAQGLAPACVSACATGCRVFGDADDPNSAVAALLATRPRVHVKPAHSDPRPSLTYLGNTTPTDWPKDVATPPHMRVMGLAATAVKWLGGLALFGVAGVFVRHLVAPVAPDNVSTDTLNHKKGGHNT